MRIDFAPDPRLGLLELASEAEALLRAGGEGSTPAFGLREALPQIEPMLRTGQLPPAALPLLGGTVAAWGSIKNYALAPYLELAMELDESAASLPHGLVAAADRTAPLGLCGQFWSEWRDVRPMLLRNEHCGPAWRVMRLAVDALAGGSREALAELARAQGPMPTWHAFVLEVIQRVADEHARVAAPLPDDPLIPTADALESGRWQLDDAALKRAQRAWRRVDTARRPRPHRTMDDPPDEIDQVIAEEEMEQGPFFMLVLRGKGGGDLMRAGWPLLVGFRQLYGIALVREALPEVHAWLARELASA